MKSKIIRIISIILLVVLILVLVTVAAGAIAKSSMAKEYPAPGKLVDVGGYTLHINCAGQGSPTIIMEAGWADFSVTWAHIQPEIARSARVCSYDRAGYGWSEPSPHPRTVNGMVDELHTLLANASVEGPYMLVGHSLGGLLMRVFADTFPDEVIGIVLVDSVHEEQALRLPRYASSNAALARQFRMLAFLSSTGVMALAPQLLPNPGVSDDVLAQQHAIWATSGYFKTAVAEIAAMEENLAAVRTMGITSFGNLPLSVLSEGRYTQNPALSEAENQQYWEEWQAMQSELAALSSQGKQTIAEQSGHGIQHDQPDLVIDVIQEMVDMLQN